MEFEELRKIQINERKNNKLQHIPDSFYQDIQKIIYPSDDVEDIHLARSKKICAENILWLRFSKIINSAENSARNKNVSQNMISFLTAEEMDLFKSLNNDMINFLESVHIENE